MRYKNLHDLINNSSSTRQYFLSLPSKMQMSLHEHNNYIHTAHELHRRVVMIKDFEYHCRLSGDDISR